MTFNYNKQEKEGYSKRTLEIEFSWIDWAVLGAVIIWLNYDSIVSIIKTLGDMV